MALSEQEEFELLSLEREKSQFGSTPGGAPVGNPLLRRQGDRALRPDSSPAEALTTIGGAAGIGGAIGTFSSEIMTGLGRAAGAHPATARLAPFLETGGAALRSAGRPVAALQGAIAGGMSETAGQAAEGMGASPMVAEGVRFAAGGLAPEASVIAKKLIDWKIQIPKLSWKSKAEAELLKGLTGYEPPQSLTKQQAEYLNKIVGEIRGGEKSDAPLEAVGSIMGTEGRRIMSAGEQQMANAVRQAGTAGAPGGYPGRSETLADIGGGLQHSIVSRNAAALDARRTQYTANERARDAIVTQREGAGQPISSLPQYGAMVAELQAQMQPGRRSPDVAASFGNILRGVSAPEGTPVSFQALDDVRRNLGEVFRGKPPEGYAAIDAATARRFYAQISDIQRRYAGEPQARLLDDYAAATPGLEQFSSKLGKKVTALDQYREGQYPDPSAIPAAFFKTRSSVQQLRELTGNPAQVNAAALAFSDKELAGKTGPQVRDWMTKNSEWLAETGPTRTLIDRYATRLEGAERSMRNAQDFAKQAAADSKMLTRQSLPAQRAVDLIKSGDTELWAKVTPAIVQSPQAKTQMVSAVRQVVADQAGSKATSDLFSRNIRPFLEQSGIATKAEMDAVSQGLAAIQAKNLPEDAKLGPMKRIILQSIGGYSASATSRAAVGGFGLLSDMVPQ